MAMLANLVGFRAERPVPLFATLAGGLGAALRRAARGRYAEQRERVERTGLAGMI